MLIGSSQPFTKLRSLRPHCRWWILCITRCGWLRFGKVAGRSGPYKKCQKFTANFTVIKIIRTSLSIRATPMEKCVYA